MKKNSYLGTPEVSDFVTWLSDNLNNSSLIHGYTLSHDTKVIFHGLTDALIQYDWQFRFMDSDDVEHAGRTYSQNMQVFAALQSELSPALAVGWECSVTTWALAAMEWRGAPHCDVEWLNTNMSGLAAEINRVSVLLSSDDDDLEKLRPIRVFNAGMSAVYALIQNDFVIYDSRLAAALAWLVTKWCQDKRKGSVPDELRFACLPAREGDTPSRIRVRNPSDAGYPFQWINNDGALHAHWNLRASWVLAEVLSNAKVRTEFHRRADPLRALEAALFMWGFDLAKNTRRERGDADVIKQSEDDSYGENHGMVRTETKTSSAAKNFKWYFSTVYDALVLEHDQMPREIFKTSEVFGVIHELYDHYGYDGFPLANDIQKMPDGSEKSGFAAVIYGPGRDVSHAQAAALLGVVLEEVGVLEFCLSSNGWRLKIEPPLAIGDLRMMLAAIEAS